MATIKRSQLKEIHTIACADWKTKIEKLAGRNSLEDEITLTDNEVLDMFNASDENQKKTLRKFLSLPKDITDRIKTFKDACNATKVNYEEFMMKFQYLPKDTLAFEMLKIIVKALNEGWVADFKNSSQYKYYMWLIWSGSSWSFLNDACTSAITDIVPRLCLKNGKLARYLFEQFNQEVIDYYTTEI